MQNNVLILDDYATHKTARIKNMLQNARTSLCFIPGGLNRFLQPLDVGVYHIVKQELRNKFAAMIVHSTGEMDKKEATKKVIQ